MENGAAGQSVSAYLPLSHLTDVLAASASETVRLNAG